MVLKLIRRSITAKPFRFLLTCSAVTLGVMFTVGVFVFTDSLRATFGDLAGDIQGNFDVAIRSEIPFGERLDAPPVSVELVEALEEIDGVAAVQPRILSFPTIPVDADGVSQVTIGPPNLGVNWEDSTPTPRLFVDEGRAPENSGEFALDIDTFADGNFTVGDSYTVLTAVEPRAFQLVGTFFFASPDTNALVGAKLVAFDTATALEVLNKGVGYDDITLVVEADANDAEVIAALEAAVPAGFEVISGADLVEEQSEEFGDIVNQFRTFLLIFAVIILLVSAFVIYNVFSILIGQRIRELGLLRAVGATGRQVTLALLGEAFMVGVVSTILGGVAGIGLGWGLRWLLQQFDFGPSGSDLLIEPLTFVAAVVVGMGVTLASAIAPALRARDVSPMAALRDDARLTRRVPEVNVVLGAVVGIVAWLLMIYAIVSKQWELILSLGVVAAFANAFAARRISAALGRVATLTFGLVTLAASLVLDIGTGPVLSLLGLAALTLFVGVNSISPFFARPAANILGRWPLAILLGIGGVVLTVAGALATFGGLFLVAISLRDVATDFDGAGIVGLIGSLVPVAVGLGITWTGIRAVDSSFILGWSWKRVVGALVSFLFGAVGSVAILVGVAGVVTAEWGEALAAPIGAVLLLIGILVRRQLPLRMKANARMARENAGRSPRRTASAAAALMIGLALVSTATVVAASFKATFADILEESVTSDWFISPGNDPQASFSSQLADDLALIDEVDTVVRFRFAFEAYETLFDGVVLDSSATNLEESLDHLDPDFVELDRTALDREAVWVHEDFARDKGLVLGNSFDIAFPDRVAEKVHIAGIFTDSSIYGNRVVSLELWSDHYPTGQDQFISLTIVDGIDEDRARAALQSITDNYPQLNVDTRDEFQDRQEGDIDQFLIIINVLVGIAIVIALLGIAITLALSVFERTRELGLVRAVGMTSRQMMRMVLFEGAIIASFGGILGIALGTVFGAAAVEVIPDSFIRTLDIPVVSLATYFAVASVAGIAAAMVPARRASRLQVLDAIAQG